MRRTREGVVVRCPRSSRRVSAAAWIAILLATGLRAGADHYDYRFGAAPFLTALRLEAIFAPLAQRLGAELGHSIGYATAADSDRFGRMLVEARFDFAFVEPLDYVRFAAAAGYRPLAALREPLVALFVARREEGPGSLAELRGSRLGLPPPQAAVSLLAASALRAAGIAVAREVELVHYRTHDACLQGLLASQVAACASAAATVDDFESALGISLRRIAESGALPASLVVAHERVDPKVRDLVRDRLIDASFSAAVTPYFRRGFSAATDADYEPVRAMWRRVEAGRAGPLAQLLFGVYPALPLAMLEQIFAAPLDRISEVAGVPTRMQTASSRERFAARLEIGHYDLALIEPLDYVRVARTIGYVPLVRPRATLGALLYVSRGSPLRSVSDLRGQRIAILAERSLIAPLAKCALRAAGLDPDRDVELVATTSHESCFEQIGTGGVVACATDDDLAAWLAAERDLVAIGRSGALAPPVVAAHPRVPDSLRSQIRDALLRWDAAQGADAPMPRLGPLVDARDGDYDGVRRIESGICPADPRPSGDG